MELKLTKPGNQGHEGCGKIVQIGSEVKSSAFQVGDLISFLAGGSCHLNCWSCERGYTQLCPNACPNGLGFDGSFAPYVAIEESAAVVLPEGVSAAVGAVTTDAVTTAYRAVVNTANVQAGQTILVFGLGGLGFNGMQIILHLGARAIIVDKRQEVLDEALKFGVKREDIVPIDADVATWVQENNLLVDTTIDFAGVPSTFKAAQESGEFSPGLTIAKICSVGRMIIANGAGFQFALREPLSLSAYLQHSSLSIP